MFRMPWSKRPSSPANGGTLAVVLQATGSHAWAVSGGWARAARDLGVLGAVLAPRGRWGAKDVDDDGGIATYLRRADSGDLAFLLGFDWHSQMLHQPSGWRRRWTRTRARKLLYVQESIATSQRLTGSNTMERSFRSAAELCDAIVFADVADRPLVEAAGKPCRWLPFGVDDRLFRATTQYGLRAPRAFFRGKVDAFADDREYAERRRMLEALRSIDLVDVIPYTPGPVQPADLVADFNRYQVAVNLPSVFAGHPTRVLEGMACGCCVVTNRTGVPEVDALFRDGVDVLYYTDETELVGAVRRARDDPEAARAIADQGSRTVANHFSLHRQLDDVLAWTGRLFGDVHVPSRQVGSTVAGG
jgi:Glycosyl transferases group 1